MTAKKAFDMLASEGTWALGFNFNWGRVVGVVVAGLTRRIEELA